MKDEMSKYRRRLFGGLIFYGIFSLGIIPAFTLIMGTKDNILTTSMSAMGNASSSMHFWFIIWTIVFCAYFAGFMGYLLMLTKNTHSKIRGFVYFAIAVLIVGNFFPFLPETFPGFSSLHNFCAQISSISLAVSLMLFALTLRNSYSLIFKKALVFVLVIWIVLVALMGLLGTKSLTEMTGIILAGIFLFTVLVWLYREDTFDPVQSLKDSDAEEAVERACRLSKKVEATKKEYLKLEAELRRAKIEAEEACRIAKHKKD